MIRKLRVWSIRAKQYEYLTDLYWFEENQVHGFDDEGYVFEEFTGLRDKTGREIYEGDIVGEQYTAFALDKKIGERKYVRVVEWQNDLCGYRPFCLDGDQGGAQWSDPDDCEVIGNIHDNPELLK